MTIQSSPATTPAAGPSAFIALEGGDGAGKSTQLRLLAQALRERGLPVVETREPGGSAMGEQIRSLVLDPQHAPVDPRTEALLFAASRSAHVQRTVRPALRDGAVVLSDRYLDSSVAYQGAGRGLGADAVRELSLWAVDGLLPDLTILLDVPEDTGRSRRADRDADRMEQEPARFHQEVRQAFLDLARADPERYLVLAADSPVEALAARILERVLGLLGPAAQPAPEGGERQ